jgi:hypothetical protein
MRPVSTSGLMSCKLHTRGQNVLDRGRDSAGMVFQASNVVVQDSRNYPEVNQTASRVPAREEGR